MIQRPTVFQEFQESPTAIQIPRHPATMGNSPFVQPLPRSLALMEMQCETLNWMCLVLRCVYSRCSISLEIGPTRFPVCHLLPRTATWHFCTTRKGSCATRQTALMVGPMPTTCQAGGSLSPSPVVSVPSAGEADRSIGAWRQWLAKAPPCH